MGATCPGKFYLEGLDISPEMLNAYRRKLATAHAPAMQQRVPQAQGTGATHEGDMCDYQLEHKGQFDLIFLPFNSVTHLYEIEQQLDAFGAPQALA